MKASEFAAWLEGYLEGKETLAIYQAEKIMEKAKEVEPEYISTPITWIADSPMRWDPYHSAPIPTFPGAMIGTDMRWQTVCNDNGVCSTYTV